MFCSPVKQRWYIFNLVDIFFFYSYYFSVQYSDEIIIREKILTDTCLGFCVRTSPAGTRERAEIGIDSFAQEDGALLSFITLLIHCHRFIPPKGANLLPRRSRTGR